VFVVLFGSCWGSLGGQLCNNLPAPNPAKTQKDPVGLSCGDDRGYQCQTRRNLIHNIFREKIHDHDITDECGNGGNLNNPQRGTRWAVTFKHGKDWGKLNHRRRRELRKINSTKPFVQLADKGIKHIIRDQGSNGLGVR